jgi:hypothetical protein
MMHASNNDQPRGYQAPNKVIIYTFSNDHQIQYT